MGCKILAVFGDASDAKAIARAEQLREISQNSLIFAFGRTYARRDKDKLDVLATRGRGFGPVRVALTFWGFVRLRLRWRGLEPRRVWARELDLALLCLLFFGRARLVYELLDLHPSLLGSGLRSKLLRVIHAFVIDRSEYVVTSSLCFLDDRRSGIGPTSKVVYLQNKLWAPADMVDGLLAGRSRNRDRVNVCSSIIRVVYSGRFRCGKSLRTLAQLVKDRRILLRVSGSAEDFVSDDFTALIDLPGVEYSGEYQYPSGLTQVYCDMDLAWCLIDDADGGTNSRLLLPNRLYESCFFGVPVVALSGTCLGKVVAKNKLGWTLPGWDNVVLRNFFEHLTGQKIADAKKIIFEQPIDKFYHGVEERAIIRKIVIDDNEPVKRLLGL